MDRRANRFTFENPGRAYLDDRRSASLGITGDRECCAPACIEGSIMPQSQRLSSVIRFAEIERPACPKCRASMRLASIRPVRAGVDLHTFEYAICKHVLRRLPRIAYEDPMKSKGLGRWLQGDLHLPK